MALAVPLAASGPASAPTQATPLNIKLGTLAPENSPWTNALRSMGTAWVKGTDGRVKLTVYAGTFPERIVDYRADVAWTACRRRR